MSERCVRCGHGREHHHNDFLCLVGQHTTRPCYCPGFSTTDRRIRERRTRGPAATAAPVTKEEAP